MYSCGRSKFLRLKWDEEALDNAVAAAQRLCRGVSESQITVALRDLMVKMFEEQAVAEDVDVGDVELEADGELDTILDVVDTSNLSQELLETVQWLRSLAVLQIVYIPIEGLSVSSGVTIGEVKLHPRNRRSELDRILATVEESPEGTSLSYIRETMERVKCYATVKSEGDAGFVRNEAIQKARQALHVLDFCLSSPMYQPSWAKIQIADVIFNETLPAEDSEGGRIDLLKTSPSSRSLESGRNKLLDVVRPIYARSFSARASHPRNWVEEQNTIEQGVDRLLTCFQSNDDVAKRIQRAVTWYSKAVDADTLEERFVNLAIALESLLIGEEQGPYATTGSTSQTLGERVAFLLGDSFENRIQKLRETKRLYSLRSAIVHRGEPITKEDLSEMDKLVKQVTLTFIKHDFKDWPAFREWMARQKFEAKGPQQP